VAKVSVLLRSRLGASYDTDIKDDCSQGRNARIGCSNGIPASRGAYRSRRVGRDQFAYVLRSDGPIMSASFFDGMNEMQTVSGLPASWSQTFTSQATYQMHSISAQTSGTQISCQVIVNGLVAGPADHDRPLHSRHLRRLGIPLEKRPARQAG